MAAPGTAAEVERGRGDTVVEGAGQTLRCNLRMRDRGPTYPLAQGGSVAVGIKLKVALAAPHLRPLFLVLGAVDSGGDFGFGGVVVSHGARFILYVCCMHGLGTRTCVSLGLRQQGSDRVCEGGVGLLSGWLGATRVGSAGLCVCALEGCAHIHRNYSANPFDQGG